MIILSKLIRLCEVYCKKISNFITIGYLKFKYPSIIIKGNTIIEKGCKIVCEDGAQLVLEDVFVSEGTMLIVSKGASLKIKKSFIGRNCVVTARKKILINSFCKLAEMVVIRDQDHKHDLSDSIVSEQGFEVGEITIESNVWIGAKATILKDVTIGENSVVGAHSLVNQSLLRSSVSVGIPAKMIRQNG